MTRGRTRGRRILRQTAELIFKRVREQAGLERPTCRIFRPRRHHFRHTFAMNRLVSWYREGKNVQRLLPHLSTYVGHRSVNETQRYLNMTAGLTRKGNDGSDSKDRLRDQQAIRDEAESWLTTLDATVHDVNIRKAD